MRSRGDTLLFIESYVTFELFEFFEYFRTESTGDGPRLCRRPRIQSFQDPRQDSQVAKTHDQNEISIFGIDFGPIWSRFGAPTWRHFRPLWRPNSAKFRPKPVLTACQHQKRDSSPNTRPRGRERKFQSQDGLQNAPRSAQDGSKRLLKTLKSILNRYQDRS